MKVCVLTTLHPPQDDRIYYKEVLSLLKRYPSLILVAPSSQPVSPNFHEGVRFVPLKVRHSMWGRFLSLVEAVNVVRKISPDICHFHDFDLVFTIPLLRLLTRAKLVYDAHEIYPVCISNSPTLPGFARATVAEAIRIIEDLGAMNCDLILTPVGSLTERFKRIGATAATIYNYPSLETSHIDEDEDFEHLKRRYRDRLVLIYQGSMSGERGLFQMLRAMKALKRSRPQIMLILLGHLGDPLLKQVKDLMGELHLEDHVEFIQWVSHPNVFKYIRLAKIGLIPFLPVGQYTQAIPIKLFEYMACGIPVLAADLPSVAYFIHESGAGKLYDSTRHEALAEGVIMMLSDEDQWQRMSENGLRAVRERWNWAKMEKRLLGVYAHLESEIQKREHAS